MKIKNILGPIIVVSAITLASLALSPVYGEEPDSGTTTEMQTRLAVTVKNIKPATGTVRVALYAEGQWLGESLAAQSDVVDGDAVSFGFDLTAPGDYGIAVYQDENDNGRLDSGFMGLPKEPYGFSNNAPIRFGPPQWDDARLSVQRGETVETTITLRD